MATSTSSSSKPAAHFQLLKISTQIKLGELTKHERKLQSHYTDLLQKIGVNDQGLTAEATHEAARQQLEDLYDGVKDLKVVQKSVHSGLEDVGGLVEFAASDPWSTEAIVAQRQQQILREVRQRRSLWQHNKLLGELLMDSLEETEHDQEDGELVSPTDGQPDSPTAAGAGSLGDVDDAGPLNGLTRDQTQQLLEKYFFQPSGVREDDVYEFLATQVFQERDNFSRAKTERQQKALHATRTRLREFGDEMLRGDEPVSEEDVKFCVAALLRDKAFLSPDVVALFTDAKRNTQIMTELAHVLTIELSNISEWRWPTIGVSVTIQRGMNGRFRCLLQEDALTLLLFQYIGLKWSVKIKGELGLLLDSISDGEITAGAQAINDKRIAMRNEFQIFALPDSMESAGEGPYDNDSSDSDSDSDDDRDNEDEKADKEDIIRRVCVEAHFQRVMQCATKRTDAKALVAVMTDLACFGPSVSHEAVFACLRFLGVRDDMLNVFRHYTEIPLLFPGFTEPKVMQRGTPVSRMMTMLLSEVELFFMDYLVLASADIVLYRSHDDICFFDTDEDKVVRAWAEMQRYANCVGLQFNMEKSGSIRMSTSPDATGAELGPAPLPPTPIHWGLLELRSNASVGIQQDKVTAFATEMADRLAAASSAFTWINVYNKYMFFFLRNFGKASPIFGLAHVNEVMETLRRVHRLVFPKTDGDALGYLRKLIARKRSDEMPPMPAAWVYWPLHLGGLGLFNPFLAVWQVKESMYSHLKSFHSRADRPWPQFKKDWEWEAPFSTVLEELKRDYELFAERLQSEGRGFLKGYNCFMRFAYMKSSKYRDEQRASGFNEVAGDETLQLRTFEEYVAVLPQIKFSNLPNEFIALLSSAEDGPPPAPKSALQTEAEAMFSKAQASGHYGEWVAYIYSAQVQEEFGTLSFFSRQLLPTQLIDAIKRKTVTW